MNRSCSCEAEREVWSYDPRLALLQHSHTGLCLKVTRQPLKLWLQPCNHADTEQKWYFTNFEEEGIPQINSQEEQLEADEEERHTEL